MLTREDIPNKIIEVDLKISALKKIKLNSNNPEGFDVLILELEKRKSNLLKLKI